MSTHGLLSFRGATILTHHENNQQVAPTEHRNLCTHGRQWGGN